MAIAEAKQLKEYMYRVTEFIIMVNGENDSVPTHCITKMSITNNFETDLFPVFKIDAVLNMTRYYNIMNNKNTVKFKLRIQKYYVAPSSDEKSLMTDYINGTFSLICDDADHNPNKLPLDQKTITGSSEVEKDNYPIELFFYRDEIATAMKTNVNTVLNGVNLTNAITYVLSIAGLKNILMTPLENQKMYSELILPPLAIHKELQHLDSQYGFYKSGALIYFGIKNSYILNYKGGATAFAAGEIQQTNFLVLKKNTQPAIDSGMFLKNDGQYNIHWRTDDIKINNDSITNDVLKGNNITVIDSSTTGITKGTSTAISKGVGNTAVVKNDTENEWVSDTYTAQSNSNSIVLTGHVSNVDLDALTPNKKFTVIFEDAKLANQYKGIYTIAVEEIEFMNRGGVDFTVIVALKLKRVSSKSSETSDYMEE